MPWGAALAASQSVSKVRMLIACAFCNKRRDTPVPTNPNIIAVIFGEPLPRLQ